jgi:hypothetical protein
MMFGQRACKGEILSFHRAGMITEPPKRLAMALRASLVLLEFLVSGDDKSL